MCLKNVLKTCKICMKIVEVQIDHKEITRLVALLPKFAMPTLGSPA